MSNDKLVHLETHVSRLESRLDARIEDFADQLQGMSDRLDVVIADLITHGRNHHGRVSTLKLTGGVTVLAGLAVAVAEILRIFLG